MPPAEASSNEARRLPWDDEAERAVLGAVMLDAQALDTAREILLESDFYSEKNKAVYGSMRAIVKRGDPVDPVTVIAELTARGKAEFVGGVPYLASLIDSRALPDHVDTYCRIVRDRATMRRFIYASEEIVSEAMAGTVEVDELVQKAEKTLLDVSKRAAKASDIVSVRSILDGAFERLEARQARPGTVTGIPTPFMKLDTMTCGWQPGQLIVLAANPSMGKSALALQFITHAASKGYGCALFSLEMSNSEIGDRMFSQFSMVPHMRIRRGGLDDTDWQCVIESRDFLDELPIVVDDRPGLKVTEFRSRCRRLVAEGKVKMAVIDHLQIMQKESKAQKEVEALTEISMTLKRVAKELRIPVIVLSQLNRENTKRTNPRPTRSDLRGSGSIEQDADMVLLLHRPEMFKPKDKVGDLKGKAELIIDKQRDGPLGSIPLIFEDKYVKFIEHQAKAQEEETSRESARTRPC